MEVNERRTGHFYVRRGVLDEPCLDEVAKKRTHSTQPSLGEQLKDSLRCSGPRLKQMVLGTVPILSWLPHYNIRENAMGDLISGISVGIMHLPQGMAYALLAALPPVFGLYTSLYPVLIYAIFGTSRHISIGTFAVISIMIGSVTERLAPDSDYITVLNGTNGTNVTEVDTDARDAFRVQIAVAITILSGLFQLVLGVVRFGFVVTYLSEPLVRAYTTGAACHVSISQLKYLFGIHPDRFSGPFSQVHILVEICSLLHNTNLGALVVSLVALAVLITVKEISACYSKKLPLPIPIELIVIIVATIISYYAELHETYDIDVVGVIPSGLKAPTVPNVSLFPRLIGDAFAVAIVGYAINISLGKTFALKHGYKVDSNQELIALGLSNTIGSFFQCYCVTSSLSRSLIQEATGSKTQVTGLVSSVIVLITVLKIGSLFEELPKAVLATIVFANLKGMFKQFLDIPELWKTNKVDLLVWIVTFLSTVLLNLDIGLAVSIAFSLLTVIFRTQLPHYSILGQVPGTELYLDTETYEEAREIPGITIFRSSTTIYYTNAELYLDALQEKSGISIGRLLTQKKKRIAKQKRQEEKEKKKAKKEAKKQNSHLSSCKVLPEEMEKDQGNGEVMSITDKPTDGHVNGKVNWAYQHEDSSSEPNSDTGCHDDHNTTQQSSAGGGTDDEKTRPGSDIHSIILDLSTASFVDTVTVKTLKNIFRDFGEIDVDIYLAACQACVVGQLDEAGFFSESLPKSRLFATVHDAVLYVLGRRGLADVSLQECVLNVSCITQM